MLLLVALLQGGTVASAADFAADLPEDVRFDEHIRPIFAAHCAACHGGVKQASGLSFVYRDRVLGEAESGVPIVVPGQPQSSHLIERVTDPDPAMRMPPADHGPPLSEREIALLRRWIAQGAEWEDPWAFVPPQRHSPPKVGDPGWCRSSLDRFVLARLEQEGLRPAPEASRREWLRRVTLDLTGLPPTRDDVRDFEEDQQDGAYRRVVDRLLASPHYGERWASMWLDLARCADTMGYEKDPNRSAWPYRDWLIRALNDDLPYDQFLIKQLAGDLLPEPSLDDLIATAFHRHTQTNTEGGTDDEEFRISAVIDRLNTTWQVFGATTFGCAQCHAHPYDPIEHHEYYQCLAFFNNTRDADLDDDFPRLSVPNDPAKFAAARELDRRIAALEAELHERFITPALDLGTWQYLAASRAETTGNGRLEVHSHAEGWSEVWAEGTLSIGSKYTLELDLPESIDSVTALRIDALPQDPGQALHVPGFGFTVSRLEAWIIPPDGEPVEVKLGSAYSDEAHPHYDPQWSLVDNVHGWSRYTRISRPCFAIFLPKSPPQIAPGSRLRLVLTQDRQANGTTAMVIRRGRFAVSNDDNWAELTGDAAVVAARDELTQLRHERQAIEGVDLPIMRERTASRARKTFQFVRGNWLDHGQELSAGVPSALPPLPEGAADDRLGLARWFVSDEHPLTARVAVNRLWAQLFGIGLVETAEDFGTSGTLPSHPELLDHLATTFQSDFGWSVKALVREIVLSSTYRQTAAADAAQRSRDPRNRLLARGPRCRLTAEMVRDQALAVSGLLSTRQYGPPVMPPQPEGIWRSVYNNAKWTTSEGEDRYRRAIYTFWKRTSPYPSMLMFDAPSREVCSARRIVTNTPLQSLVTLNDPVYVECAAALAQRMQNEADASIRAQISLGYELVVGQPPSPGDLIDLLELYAATAAEAGERDDDVRQYALQAVASVLLNCDRALTR